jgi:antitoxin (DNA-binding transcriptional repressor) of toxin-antitoxin stability system
MKASSSPVRRGKILKAGVFKASALAVMRRVHETGEGVVVTSRGRPLVRIEPVGEENLSRGYGCMKKAMEFLGPDEDLVAPEAAGAWGTLAEWDELQPASKEAKA